MTEADNEAQITTEDIEEEVLPDWGIINQSSTPFQLDPTVETIPRRSDKYFDPDGSSAQTSKLEESRRQMYLALLSIRGHHIKLLLVAVWVPAKNAALVPHAKGNFFKDIGTAHHFKLKSKLQGMWLSPIETVYLTERGSLITYLANDHFVQYIDSAEQDFPYESLLQLSMSHLYSLAFGSDPHLRDKYQVYALLKRSGYIILEFRQYFDQYESWSELQKRTECCSIWSKVVHWFSSVGSYARNLSSHYRTAHYFDYRLVFQSLQYLTTYSAFDSLSHREQDPRYRLTFNVWKPSPSFSKKSPPMPDFQVAIVNIAQVPFPPLVAIQGMWNQLNFSFDIQKKPEKKAVTSKKPTKKDIRLQKRKERESKLDPIVVARNNYLRLRDSKLKSGVGRSVVLASIDNGIINFTALNETEFKLSTPVCIQDLDELQKNIIGKNLSNTSHGTLWLSPRFSNRAPSLQAR